MESSFWKPQTTQKQTHHLAAASWVLPEGYVLSFSERRQSTLFQIFLFCFVLVSVSASQYVRTPHLCPSLKMTRSLSSGFAGRNRIHVTRSHSAMADSTSCLSCAAVAEYTSIFCLWMCTAKDYSIIIIIKGYDGRNQPLYFHHLKVTIIIITEAELFQYYTYEMKNGRRKVQLHLSIRKTTVCGSAVCAAYFRLICRLRCRQRGKTVHNIWSTISNSRDDFMGSSSFDITLRSPTFQIKGLRKTLHSSIRKREISSFISNITLYLPSSTHVWEGILSIHPYITETAWKYYT